MELSMMMGNSRLTPRKINHNQRRRKRTVMKLMNHQSKLNLGKQGRKIAAAKKGHEAAWEKEKN